MSEKRSGTVFLGAAGVLALIAGTEMLSSKSSCKPETSGAQTECSSSRSGGSSTGGRYNYGGGPGSSESSTARGGFGSSGHSFFGGS